MLRTCLLGENVMNVLKQKEAQNVAISLGFFIFSKNHKQVPKLANLAKKTIWSHCPHIT
jgi:hypothetical protein